MNITLLLPDGVGVRNFLYTDFVGRLLAEGHTVAIWADEQILTLIEDDRVQKYILPTPIATTVEIEITRKAWQTATLKWQARKFEDPVYLDYRFPQKLNSVKSVIKLMWERWLVAGNVSAKGVQRLRKSYLQKSTRTPYFDACLAYLEKHKPDIILCTHQRASNAIAPLLAAQKQGIPTACFIFSWDNLPKATLFVEADHYLVWSEHMKQEMIAYHGAVDHDRIHVVGTPQFQPYFDSSLRISREAFCAQYKLDPTKRFICFTGDDVTTSPHDQIYLKHLAESVLELNRRTGDQFRILFRRCPVDWSDRYDEALRVYGNILYAVDPLWTSQSGNGNWSYFVPSRADVALLVNTVLHADLTVNIGSTTALDFAALGKPACYIRYNASEDGGWDIYKVYRFVHFRSMNGLDPVYWIDSRETMANVLMEAMADSKDRVVQAQTWHQRIAMHPLEEAHKRIGKTLEKLAGHTHAYLLPHE